MKGLLILALLAMAAAGCARDDGMGETWKGVRCVEVARCN